MKFEQGDRIWDALMRNRLGVVDINNTEIRIGPGTSLTSTYTEREKNV